MSENSRMTYPNLFIVGAMKSGTSSLHHMLGCHPEIYMSEFKEPQYFCREPSPEYAWFAHRDPPDPQGRWYFSLFDPAYEDKRLKFAGESSTSYTKRPLYEGSAEKIFDYNPDSRIIFIMRDPVDRAVSHYWHTVRTTDERRCMLDVFKNESDYLSFSDYAYQLEPFYATFGKDQIYLLTLESFKKNPGDTLCEILSWLGVENFDYEFNTEKRKNVTPEIIFETRWGMSWIARFLRSNARSRLSKKIPRVILKFLHKIAYRHKQKEPSQDHDKAINFIRHALFEKYDRLCKLADRDFPEWKTLHDMSR